MEDNSENSDFSIRNKSYLSTNRFQIKSKEENSSLNNNTSKQINTEININLKSEELTEIINNLSEFSDTLKRTQMLNSTKNNNINKILTNKEQIREEKNNKQNSSIDFKNISLEVEKYNEKINSYFDDIKKQIIQLSSISQIKENSIKDDRESIKVNSFVNKISTVRSITNSSETYRDINIIKNILEQSSKNKYVLDKKTKLYINESKNFISSEGLNKKNPLIEEINVFMQKTLNKSIKVKQDSNNNNNSDENDKTLFDLISEIFKVQKYELVYSLLNILDEQFNYTEEHKAEIFKNFNSKIKKVYDAKKDGDSLIVLIYKLLGKKNLVFVSSTSISDKNHDKIHFFKGNFKFANSILDFIDSELYSYEGKNGEFKLDFAKSENSKLYTKLEKDYIYILFYAKEKLNIIAKITNNFLKNPVLRIDKDKDKVEIQEFIKKSSEEISKIFNKDNTEKLKVNELTIYEIPEE